MVRISGNFNPQAPKNGRGFAGKNGAKAAHRQALPSSVQNSRLSVTPPFSHRIQRFLRGWSNITRHMMDSPKAFAKGAGTWATALAGITALYHMAKPYALALLYGEHRIPLGGDIPGKGGSMVADQQRRQRFEAYIVANYLTKDDGKICWKEAADIVDVIAANTQSDHDFRRDVWYFFGWRQDGSKSPLLKFMDHSNPGLSAKLHNRDWRGNILYHDEQVHHYLGGTIGNFDSIPDHLTNNPLGSLYYETRDYLKKGQFNWGDVAISRVARRHRDEFLKHGRFVVGRNMRSVLGA